MKLLADENIPDELIELLLNKGYEIITAPRASKDHEIALIARKKRCVILTQDRDFANIILYPPKSLHGVIRLRFHPPVISDIFPALEDLFNKFSPEDLDGRLVALQRNGFRIR